MSLHYTCNVIVAAAAAASVSADVIVLFGGDGSGNVIV